MALNKNINKQRLLISSNNFDLLRLAFPTMKVGSLTASTVNTTAKSEATPCFLKNGVQFASKFTDMGNRTQIYFNQEFDKAPTFPELSEAFRLYHIPNPFVSLLTYLKEDKNGGAVHHITFAKYTPHRKLDLQRIADGGSYPDQELYEFQRKFREAFVEKHLDTKDDKSTALLLMDIQPNQEAIDDPTFLNWVKYPFMQPYWITTKEWNIASAKFKKGYI